MPHDDIQRYLKEVETAIGNLQNAYVEFYEEELLTPERLNLRIRVRFYGGCLLELNESVVNQDGLKHLGYRYHFQDKKGNLIFRYDNTPHFPDLPTFPHHKHTMAKVDSADMPTIVNAIREAGEIASHSSI